MPQYLEGDPSWKYLVEETRVPCGGETWKHEETRLGCGGCDSGEEKSRGTRRAWGILDEGVAADVD